MTFNHMKTDHREREEPTPKGMINIVRREVAAGGVLRTQDGAVYVAREDGSIKRVDKTRMSKKERRARRATVKAVRKARLEGT